MIVRNFFDLEKYKNIKPVSEGKPKQFLINTNYSDKNDPVVAVVRETAKHFGAKVAAVGANFAQSFDLTRAIEDSDVVFGMGRSVLEGVAAGRLGIVHGRWGTGGAINLDNIDDLRKFNFSGRNSNGGIATKEELIEMIDKNYNSTGSLGRAYVAENHNATLAAEAYIRLARDLTGQNIVRPRTVNTGVDPEARPFKRAQ